jgi:hypothetical protein
LPDSVELSRAADPCRATLGAVSHTADAEWKNVLVRRYLAFLEHSLEEGLDWAVFEPNGERLWGNVRAAVEDFLLGEFRDGALVGTKPEEAFFVRCDRTTMTQNDLDNGRLVCLVGVAPLKPAEFVIIRIGRFLSPGGSAERNRYFEGRLLTAADLEREQAYLRDKRLLHNRFLHGPGVVHGLGVTVDDGCIVVEAGLALDATGREIVVPSPHRLCPDDHVDDAVSVVLRYVEHETDHATIREGYELRLAVPGAVGADDVVLAELRCDESGLAVEPARHS